MLDCVESRVLLDQHFPSLQLSKVGQNCISSRKRLNWGKMVKKSFPSPFQEPKKSKRRAKGYTTPDTTDRVPTTNGVTTSNGAASNTNHLGANNFAPFFLLHSPTLQHDASSLLPPSTSNDQLDILTDQKQPCEVSSSPTPSSPFQSRRIARQ